MCLKNLKFKKSNVVAIFCNVILYKKNVPCCVIYQLLTLI